MAARHSGIGFRRASASRLAAELLFGVQSPRSIASASRSAISAKAWRLLSSMKRRTAMGRRAGVMPPWYVEQNIGIQEYKFDPSLSDKEVAMMGAWADAGAPRGNVADAPPPRDFGDGGWTIGEPDLITTLPELIIGGEQPEEGPAGTLDLTFRTPDGEEFCRDDNEPPDNRIVFQTVLRSLCCMMAADGKIVADEEKAARRVLELMESPLSESEVTSTFVEFRE